MIQLRWCWNCWCLLHLCFNYSVEGRIIRIEIKNLFVYSILIKTWLFYKGLRSCFMILLFLYIEVHCWFYHLFCFFKSSVAFASWGGDSYFCNWSSWSFDSLDSILNFISSCFSCLRECKIAHFGGVHHHGAEHFFSFFIFSRITWIFEFNCCLRSVYRLLNGFCVECYVYCVWGFWSQSVVIFFSLVSSFQSVEQVWTCAECRQQFGLAASAVVHTQSFFDACDCSNLFVLVIFCILEVFQLDGPVTWSRAVRLRNLISKSQTSAYIWRYLSQNLIRLLFWMRRSKLIIKLFNFVSGILHRWNSFLLSQRLSRLRYFAISNQLFFLYFVRSWCLSECSCYSWGRRLDGVSFLWSFDVCSCSIFGDWDVS